MKKSLRKALVLLLALSMVFTTTGLPAFAAEGDPAPGDEPAAEEMLAEPAEGETGEQETQVLTDGTYTAKNLSTAVLSMYHFDTDTARVVVKGDEAWLITSIDGTQEANTLKRFDGMAYGPQSEILDATDETNHTLVEGTPVANVIDIYDDEETVIGRTFVLPVPKSVFEAGGDIYYMLKYTAGYSTSHDGDWYKATGGDYYLTGYTLEKVSDSTDLPVAEEPAEDPAEEPEVIDLEMENEQGMFRAVSASLETYPDGSRILVFALSGTGYIGMYKGTYPEAVRDKDAIVAALEANESTDKTSVYQTNEDGKYEFRIPLDEDQTYIPLISVSKRGFDNRATKPIEDNGFYARQVVLQNDCTKMWLGDYDETTTFTLSTELADFKADTAVSTNIKGGPVNNNYSVAPTFTMTDGTYDSVTYPSVVDNAVGTKTAALEDGKFVIDMENAPSKKAFQDKAPLTFTFHVAENAPYEEAGTDVVRTVTFDQIAKTITVEGTPLTEKEPPAPTYAAGEYIVGVKSIKLEAGTDYGMFVPRYNGVNNTALVTVAEDGTATIFFDNNRNTYNAIFLGEPENLNQVPTEEQKASASYILTKTEGSVAPFEFEFAFKTSNLGKTVPYVTVSRSSGKFNATQLAFVFDDSMTTKAAFDVIQMIDALPDAADVTVRSKDAIEAARAAYEALTDDQKAEVTNLSKLTAAEEAFASLAGKDEATEAVEAAIESLIQNYIDVNETTAAAVAAAHDAYDALSVQQKAYISDETYQKLARAEACVQFADPAVRNSGIIVDAGINTDSGSIVGTVLGGPGSDTYLYIYTDANTKIKKVSGTVSQSTQKVIGDGKLMETIWLTGTTEPHGREFVIQLTDLNGNAKGEEITVKIPGAYGTLAEGTYEVAAIQTPSSKMRKYERSTITSDGTAMNVEFVMPNTSYGKIFLGTKEEAEAATEGFIEPTGTEATSGTTGEGNVYTMPLESMYMPITISYYSTKNGTWTQETVEFVVDEQAKSVIDAIAALNLNTYFNVTIDQRDQVTLADGLHKALNDNQKAIVANANYSTLKKTVAMFVIADKTAAQVEALPVTIEMTVAEMSADDVALVREVKDAFDNMGHDPELMEALNGYPLQNTQLEKLISQELRDKLTSAVDKADEFEKGIADAIALIEALPEADSVAEADYEAVLAAHNAYAGLNDSQKALVTNHDKLAACEEKTPADYTVVDNAVAAVPADLSIYTEETVQTVEDAVAAATADDRTKKLSEQDAIDAMAKAINDAVDALELKPADYAAVDTALAAVPEDLSIYTEDTAAAVTAATNAVDRTKKITEQAEVDAMAAAINDAVAALALKQEQSIAVPATAITKTYGDAAFSLDAETSGDGELSYSSENTKVATVSSDGKVTIKGAGKTTITINAAETGTYKTASATVSLTVNKAAQSVTGPKATITRTYGNKAFNLNAKAKGTLTYSSSNKKVATVSKTGKVTIKGAGTAKITIKAAATDDYKAATKTVTIKVNKAKNTVTAKGKTVSVKASKVKKGAQTITKAKAFSISKNKGKVTFKKSSGNKKITVSKAGKITVKKGLKKGTYKVKVKVTAAGNSNYKKLTKTVTVTIKVK